MFSSLAMEFKINGLILVTSVILFSRLIVLPYYLDFISSNMSSTFSYFLLGVHFKLYNSEHLKLINRVTNYLANGATGIE